MGLPLNMDDTESEMSERARSFAGRLAKETSLPVEMADERLSSRAAAEDYGNKSGNRSDQSHAAAAALIAETWLAERG